MTPLAGRSTAEHLGRRGIHRDDLASRDEAAIDVLVRAEVVPAILDQRAAEGRGEVVDLGVGLERGVSEEERARRHRIATEAVAGGTVQRVGARRRDRVVDHARRLAELRREAVGDYLDLAHQHFRDRKQAEPCAILLGVGVPIQLIVGSHLRAVRVDARHAELRVLEPRHVRLEEREIVGIPRHERQVADFLLADGSSEIDLAGLRDWRLARHRHGFRHAANRQLDVDQDDLSRREGHALLLEGLEALELRDDLVAAERQQDGSIDAVVVGQRGPRRAGVHVRHRHGRARECRPRRIANDAFDVPVRGLGLPVDANGRRGGRRAESAPPGSIVETCHFPPSFPAKTPGPSIQSEQAPPRHAVSETR